MDPERVVPRVRNSLKLIVPAGRRKLPFAFTEHGAIVAATVLNSPSAKSFLSRDRPVIGGSGLAVHHASTVTSPQALA